MPVRSTPTMTGLSTGMPRTIDFVMADVTALLGGSGDHCSGGVPRGLRGCVDTVLMNPPFGTKKKGVDMEFLAAAFQAQQSQANLSPVDDAGWKGRGLCVLYHARVHDKCLPHVEGGRKVGKFFCHTWKEGGRDPAGPFSRSLPSLAFTTAQIEAFWLSKASAITRCKERSGAGPRRFRGAGLPGMGLPCKFLISRLESRDLSLNPGFNASTCDAPAPPLPLIQTPASRPHPHKAGLYKKVPVSAFVRAELPTRLPALLDFERRRLLPAQELYSLAHPAASRKV
eukprot:365469-Chlamydomonas_euryale.AAC.3